MLKNFLKPALAGAVLTALIACSAPVSADDDQAADQVGGAETDAWTVDYESSRLGFSGTQTGDGFTGEFKDFQANIVFDPDNLEAASIDVQIDPASAQTGDKQRDRSIPARDWFHTKEYETASFVSDDVRQTGDGTYEAHGVLTIRDISKDVVLPFSLKIGDDGAAVAEGALTLVRTDYNVGQGEFSSGEWVGLDVQVDVKITATK